jgi:hypothetical protein
MVFRRRAAQPVDPLAHVDPARAPARMRAHVADALDARRRYRELVEGMQPGALRERMEAAGSRVDAGVEGVWATVMNVQRVEQTLQHLDPEGTAAKLKNARRAVDAGDGDPALLEALAARFASIQQLLNSVDDVDRQLALLDARMGAAVARAAEIALRSGSATVGDVDGLSHQLDSVVAELGAVQQALDSVS